MILRNIIEIQLLEAVKREIASNRRHRENSALDGALARKYRNQAIITAYVFMDKYKWPGYEGWILAGINRSYRTL
jgi:hypothetical protein